MSIKTSNPGNGTETPHGLSYDNATRRSIKTSNPGNGTETTLWTTDFTEAYAIKTSNPGNGTETIHCCYSR